MRGHAGPAEPNPPPPRPFPAGRGVVFFPGLSARIPSARFPPTSEIPAGQPGSFVFRAVGEREIGGARRVVPDPRRGPFPMLSARHFDRLDDRSERVSSKYHGARVPACRADLIAGRAVKSERRESPG